MAELQINIAANVGNAVQGLNKVQTELDQTGKQATALSSSVVKASGAISKLPQSAGQANQAITNLNRVVQDAPFGFIGIQNNIGPLIDSFGQLKMSTGSTGGALKSLIGSLAGPAGIGLAVAAVSSALTFAIQGFSSWTRGLGAAKEANDKLAESLSVDLVRLTTIVGLAQNVSASTEDRAKAIKLLNQEYAQYLPSLDKEAITLDNVNQKYKILVDTILRQAVVKGLQETIAKQVEETAKQVTALELAREKERLELEKGNKTKFTSLTADQKLKQIAGDKNKAISDGVIAYNKQTQAEQAAIGTTNVYEMMVASLKAQLIESLQPALNLANAFSDLNQNLDKGKNIKLGKLDFSSFLQQDEIEVPLTFPGEVQIERGINPVAALMKNALEKYFKRTEPLDASLLLALDAEKLKKFEFMGFKGLTEAQKDLAEMGATISGLITPAFDAMIQAIGRGENAFKAFGDGVKATLIQVIQKLTATAILAGVLAALFPGTGVGGAKGFGAIFGKLLGFRANGGPVTGNSPYIVGERGPELFVPSVSGSIVPNNSVGSFMSGRGGDSGRGSVLRGQDIILAYARTQRSQLRVNG
jgi:hypothetical protein